MDYRCRACLNMHENFINIFEYLQNNRFTFEMLMECTTVKVQKDDGLPATMCCECLEKLNSAYNFKAMVIESDAKLRNSPTNFITESDLRNNFVFVKEEMPFYESENINTFLDLNEDTQYGIMCEKTILNRRTEDPTYLTPDTNKLVEYETSFNSETKQETHLVDDHSLNSLDCNVNQIDKENKMENNETFLENEEEDTRLPAREMQTNGSNKRTFSTKERDKMSFFCKLCNRSFGYRYYFEIHVRHHNGNKPFKCDVCSKSFAKQFQLNVHKSVHSNDRPFTCDSCGKMFRTTMQLRSHKVVHSEERPHVCNICNKSFKQESSLKVHMLRHTNEKKCVCEVCGKLFADSSSLSNHKLCHRIEKNFPCPTCGKLFISNGAMKKHLKQHSNAKPYACTYCDKSFKYKNAKENHVLVHTGEKPHACKICGKTFRQAACIPRHMRIHTGETPYPCELCEAKFKYSHHLLNHMKMHKKEVLEN